MRQFCEYHVEAVSREADHLAITALTRALQTPLRIAYLDQSSLPQLAAAGDDAEAEVNFLEFEEEAAKRGEKGVEGALLYRASLFRVPLSHERCLLVQAAADWRVTQVPDTTTCCTGEVRRAASGEGGPEDCRGRRTSPGEIVARSYKGRCVDNPALSTRTSGLRGKRRIVRERGGWLRVEKEALPTCTHRESGLGLVGESAPGAGNRVPRPASSPRFHPAPFPSLSLAERCVGYQHPLDMRQHAPRSVRDE